MDKLTFKETMQLSVIPAVQRMITSEQVHYEHLCTFDEKEYPIVSYFKQRSQNDIQQLTNRLSEYIQYIENL